MARIETKTEDVLVAIHGLLDTLTPEQREELSQNITIRKFKKNEVIYSEGDIPEQLLCLIHGKVKIYKDGVGGRAQIMRVCDAVEYFGYRARMAGEPFITAAAAFETSTIAQIPLSLIIRMMHENAELACFFVKRLASVLGTSDERTVNLTQKHIRGRLAESILYLKDHYGVEEDGCTLSIYLSREDLANLSNMTTSNAIRTLSAFATEHLLAIDGRKIKIINEAKLQKVSING